MTLDAVHIGRCDILNKLFNLHCYLHDPNQSMTANGQEKDKLSICNWQLICIENRDSVPGDTQSGQISLSVQAPVDPGGAVFGYVSG